MKVECKKCGKKCKNAHGLVMHNVRTHAFPGWPEKRINTRPNRTRKVSKAKRIKVETLPVNPPKEWRKIVCCPVCMTDLHAVEVAANIGRVECH